MKIVVTGSLGHISKPLAEELVQKGHDVTVISSDPNKKALIEALGAKAIIGKVQDVELLAAAFTGADAVYTMVPPTNYFIKGFDLTVYCHQIADSYAQAIEQTGVKRVVHLSSVGADMDKDSGLILAHHDVEVRLSELTDVAITFMRPVGFYYNLFSFIGMIKGQGHIAANYGADDDLVWVSPIDIAAAVAEELERPATENSVRYVVSDEVTGNYTAKVLGEAIGKPDLQWILISDEQMQANLEAVGMDPKIAGEMTQMFSSQHNGKLTADYYRNKPAVMGNVKINDFAKEFEVVYNQR